MTYFISGAALHSAHIQFLHESSVTIFAGILFGFIFHEVFHAHYVFDTHAVFFYILPPIVFNEGYNLDRRRFAKNFRSILKYGIFGSILVFIMLSALIYLISEVNIIESLHCDSTIHDMTKIFLLAAALSNSDTNCIVEMLGEENYPDLCSILFGQSILNEAIIILLFNASRNSGCNELNITELGGFGYQLVESLGYSVVIGVVTGFVGSYLLKVFYDALNHHYLM
jgi:NhaP-type Na+/H+ or K+/H+ antiporter